MVSMDGFAFSYFSLHMLVWYGPIIKNILTK